MKRFLTDSFMMLFFIILSSIMMIIEMAVIILAIILSPLKIIKGAKRFIALIGLPKNLQAQLKKLRSIDNYINYCQNNNDYPEMVYWHCQEAERNFSGIAGPKPHQPCLCHQALKEQKIICLKAGIPLWRIRWIIQSKQNPQP